MYALPALHSAPRDFRHGKRLARPDARVDQGPIDTSAESVFDGIGCGCLIGAKGYGHFNLTRFGLRL